MATTTTSPNMGMPVPVVSEDPGVDWANNINASLSIIDSHTHSSGQGVPITPSGISINADLPVNGNNLTTIRSLRFTSQISPLAQASDIGCLYESGADLYYNDGAGNQVRITQSGSVTGSAGTITGLPSGTASASFAGATFTFKSATNTPATMAVGPLVIGSATASPKTVTLAPSASQPSNYSLTLPLAAPAANQTIVSDGSGNLSWSLGLLPVGSIIATFPNLTGAFSTVASTVADAYGFVLCQGQTIADASSPMNGQVVPNINNSVFILGNTTAGTSGGAATASGVGAHTHTFSSGTTWPTSGHGHNFPHYHQWTDAVFVGGTNHYIFYSINDASKNSATTAITTSSNSVFQTSRVAATGSDRDVFTTENSDNYFTTGALGATDGSSGSTAHTNVPTTTDFVTGTTASTGSSFSIIPPYISAVYIMRIK